MADHHFSGGNQELPSETLARLKAQERRATDGQRAGVPEGWEVKRSASGREILVSAEGLGGIWTRSVGYDGMAERLLHWLAELWLAAAPTPPSYIELRQQYGEMHRERITNPTGADFAPTPPAGDAGQERCEEATDEMIDAACAAVPGLYRVDAMRAIEAALKARGKA